MRPYQFFLAVVATAMFAVTPALAQQRSDDRQSDRQRENQTRTERQRENQSRTERQRDQDQQREKTRAQSGSAEGQVEKTKRVRVRHTGEEHLIAVLKRENGKGTIVDLGPVKDIERFGLATGDTIMARGDLVAVGNREVLMARQIRNERGDTQNIRQPRPRGNREQRGQQRRDRNADQREDVASRNQQRQRGKNITGSGEIIRTKKVNVRGQGREHLVVLMETQKGERRVADLGPVKQFKNIELKSGDQITVTGDVVNVGESQVIAARKVEVDERTVRIERAGGGRQI
ncbi:MAG: hypothetical protein CMJ46_15620 [Planctomyces sp.]|nr:hypothetical protein [Planctomyces sp.]